MKSMRKRAARITSAALAVFCCCALLLACVPAAQAAGMTASVVTGPVTLNGQKVDNAGAEYPLQAARGIAAQSASAIMRLLFIIILTAVRGVSFPCRQALTCLSPTP